MTCPNITALIARINGNVTYDDGSEGSFSAEIDEKQNISVNDPVQNQRHSYILINTPDAINPIQIALFAGRASLIHATSPEPTPPAGLGNVTDWAIQIWVLVTNDDGSNDHALILNTPTETITTSHTHLTIDRIILNSTYNTIFRNLLAAINTNIFYSRNADPALTC